MKLIVVVSVLVAAAAAEEILSYDAGDHSHTASGEPGSSVSGSYSLQTPDGDTITVQYTADENGYVAVSDALPQPVPLPDVPAVPEVPEVKAAADDAAADDADAEDEVKVTAVHAAAHPAFVAPLPYAYAAHPAVTYAAHPVTYAAAVDPCAYGAVPCHYGYGHGFAYSTGSVHVPYVRYHL